MATVEQVTYNSPDGATMGQSSTEKISFYGATPVTRYVGAGAASTYIHEKRSTGAMSTWGFADEIAVTSLVHQISTLTVAFRNAGLID